MTDRKPGQSGSSGGEDGGRHRSSDGGGGEVEHRASDLLNALPDAVLETTDAGRILWANNESHARFGYGRGHLRDQLISILVGPFANESEGRQLVELIDAGRGEMEVTTFTREGVSMPSRIRVTTPDRASGQRLVIVSDESERAQLRTELVLKAEAIQREKEILRATSESIEEGVLVVDDTERLVLVNDAACRLLGVSASSAQGRPLATVDMPSILRGKWLAFLASSRSTAIGELALLVDGEVRNVIVQMARVVSARRIPLGSVMIVTEIAGEAQKIEAAESFSAFSHELRTPLTSIQGFLEALRSEDLTPEQRAEFLDILERDTRRLGRLIEGLLEIAFLQNSACDIERGDADMVRVLREAAAIVGREEQVPVESLEMTVPEELIAGRVDRERMQKVIVELLRNAVRHGWTERGVKVALESRRGMVRLRIRDFGRGVDQEHLEKVFDPFRRVSETVGEAAGRGAGLGLALCRQVIDRHAGTIRARNAEGSGLEVEIQIPGGVEAD